jgi:hypothetical protein
MIVPKCIVCNSNELTTLRDFGNHPVATHFHRPSDQPPITHLIQMAVCQSCGAIQLSPPVPSTSLKSPHDWLIYREPEAHLDNLVLKVLTLDGISSDSRICGVSVKDASTIERFVAAGVSNSFVLSAKADLLASTEVSGIESIQALLNAKSGEYAAKRRSKCDLILARHIIEHTENTKHFMQGLDALTREGGWVILEIPDCERNLKLRDYTMLWEEHSLYLTEDTVPSVFHGTDFQIMSIGRHSYPYEDILVLFARKNVGTNGSSHENSSKTANASVALATSYADDFTTKNFEIRKKLEGLRCDGKLAIFGAGHIAASFVNLHGLTDLFCCIIDDTPEKQGMILPGTRLLIRPASTLVEEEIKHCFLALAPENEDKVIAKNNQYVSQGGQFHSVVVASERFFIGS